MEQNDEITDEARKIYEEMRPPTDLSSPMFFNIRISGDKGEEVIECADLRTLAGFIAAYQKYSDEGMNISLEWERVSLN